jgi:outer membrane lipase/esterase
MRKLILATATIAAVHSSLVFSAPFSDIYVFGDSLFDTGNYGGLRFTNRVGPDYQNSPFGPVSPDLVAAGVGLNKAAPSAQGDTNYAVGGNRSLQTLQSVTAETTYEAPEGGNFNSLFYDLSRSGRDFDRKALYVLDGGGNDVGNGLVFNEETAGVVATNVVQAATALKERGAKAVFLVNVPDFGLAPRGIPFQEFASAQVDSINRQILEQVGSENILIFDAASAFREIVADPQAYGVPLTTEQVSRSCFGYDSANCSQGNADAKIDGANPDPDQFFFNDELHATTIGQEVFADYMLSVLQAPAEIALLSEMGLDDMQAHWRSAHPVMRSNRWMTTTDTGKYTVWGGLSGGESERDTAFGDTGTNEIFQYDMGINYRISQSWYLGGMLSRADNELDFDDSDSNYEMESLNFSLISGLRGERWFIEGALSYSDLDYDDMKRSFSLGPVLNRTEKSDTNGETYGLLINAGYNMLDSQRYRLGPMVGYDYINVEVDGYTEKGNTATALVVDDQKTITGIWNLGAYGDMQLGFCDCTLYSEAVYQSFARDGSTNPRIGLVTQPGNSAALAGYERDDDGWRWDVGMTSRLSDAFEVSIEAGVDDADNTQGFWVGGQASYSF